MCARVIAVAVLRTRARTPNECIEYDTRGLLCDHHYHLACCRAVAIFKDEQYLA